MMVSQHIFRFYHQFPALFFFLIYAAGIGTGWKILTSVDYSLLLLVGHGLFLLSLLSFLYTYKIFYPAILFLIFILGLLSIFNALALKNEKDICAYPADTIDAISGEIADPVYKEDGHHRYLLKVDSVWTGNTGYKASGPVLLYQGRMTLKFLPGEKICIKDKLHLPPLPDNPGRFNYRRYLQMNGVFYQYYIRDTSRILRSGQDSVISKASFSLSRVKRSLITRMHFYLKEPAKSMLPALLLGEKGDLDRDLVHSFQMTGVVHVLAISGLHVGFIILIFQLAFSVLRFTPVLKTAGIIIGLVIYVIIVEYKISVVRAAVMAGLYLISKLFQRPVDPLNTLAASGVLILVMMPQQLLMPGFQFSFAAVGGILYGFPRLNSILLEPFSSQSRWFRVVKKPSQAFLVSLAATLGTAPLTWLFYGYLPLTGVLLNLIIIPCIGLLVCAGILFSIFMFLPFMPVEGFAYLLTEGTELMTDLVARVALLPGIVQYIPNEDGIWVFPAFFLVFLIFSLQHAQARWLLYISTAFVVSRTLIYVPVTDPGTLRLWYLDVGQGDAIVIRAPGGEVVLIDAGEKYGTDRGENVVVPFLRQVGIHRIHYLVGTHGHSDHIGGIGAIMRDMQVDTLVFSGYPSGSKLYDSTLDMASSRNIPLKKVGRGDQLASIRGLRIFILHPAGHFTIKKTHSGKEVNNSSIVLLVQYGQCRFLFTGDLEKSAEPYILKYAPLLRADILKVGHHGSKTSTSIALLEAVSPIYSVVSVGRFNRFSHPSTETLGRIWKHNIPILRTDHLGALHFESDGSAVTFVNWRTGRRYF